MYPNFDDPYSPYNPGGDPYVEPTAPQADPNAWLYDQSTPPSLAPPAGQTWMWNGNQWTLASQAAINNLGAGEATNPFGASGGGGGGMSEAEGRAYDQQNGLIGGYMTPQGWVNGSPSSGSGGGGGGAYNPMGGSYDPSGFSWPQFAGPTFTKPPDFSHEAFAAPDPQSIFTDPSYKMRRDEGLQAIEHGAAARGLARLPATLKSLAGWNQDFASREYGNIFDRSAQTYDRNRSNAADTYSLNYGIGRDVFDRNYTSARDQFQFNQFEPAKLTFTDLYNRWKSELDSTTQIATAGAGL